MSRLAWRLLSSCLIAALAACTGSTVAAPAPSHTRPVPVAVTSAAAGTRPAPTSPAAMRSVVAVVAGYYRAVVTRNYRGAFGYLAPGATGPDGHRLTLGSFLSLARTLDGIGGPVTRFSAGAYPPEVVMTNYRASFGPYHAHLRMVRTGDAWAISAIDRI